MHRVRNGKRNKSNVLDCVISTKLYDHDLDTTTIGGPYGLISGINIVEIPSDTDLQKELGFAAKKANYNAVFTPMGQIAYVYKIKFSAPRILSDFADSAGDYEKTCHMRQVCYQKY